MKSKQGNNKFSQNKYEVIPFLKKCFDYLKIVINIITVSPKHSFFIIAMIWSIAM